nr:branched-chain amino acid transport system II carrier protein [Actinobaculum sp. 352]
MSGLLATALTLFSMFFGAGNLIFPPMLGAQAGANFPAAIAGFLIGAVLLPVASVIAVAVSGTDARDVASRAGTKFGAAFAVLCYLSIGAFYGLPRTGAVSFSTAIQPLTGWSSGGAAVGFNAAFFAVAVVLAYNPRQVVNRLGKALTPVLLVLLVLLVWRSVSGNATDREAEQAAADVVTGAYASHPLSAGLLEGYMTMDSVAALAFGIIVVSSLKYRGVREGRPVVYGAAIAATIAGALLAFIYLGLGLIGRTIPNSGTYNNGAALLSDAAGYALGRPGRVVLGLIVVLACLTTAVGLLAASGQFFHRLVPQVSYHVWVLIFGATSFGVASLGLRTVLRVAAPLIAFLYPVAITVVVVTLLDALLRAVLPGYRRLQWGFTLPVWAAAIWSALVLLEGFSWGNPLVAPLVNWVPLASAGLGWILPVCLALLGGMIADAVVGRSVIRGDNRQGKLLRPSQG